MPRFIAGHTFMILTFPNVGGVHRASDLIASKEMQDYSPATGRSLVAYGGLKRLVASTFIGIA
jgi:hypothetical protein